MPCVHVVDVDVVIRCSLLVDFISFAHVPPAVTFSVAEYVAYHQGRNQKFIWGCFSPTLTVPFLPSIFPSLSPVPRSGPSNPAKGFEECCWPQRKRTTFPATRHVPWTLNTPNIVFAADPGSPLREWPQFCRPVSVKQNLKIEGNVVVSECTVCYLIKFYVIIFYILFRGRGFNAQNTPLVSGPWARVNEYDIICRAVCSAFAGEMSLHSGPANERLRRWSCQCCCTEAVVSR